LEDNLNKKLAHLLKVKRKKGKPEQDSDHSLHLQASRGTKKTDHCPKVYRLVKASTIEKLKELENFGTMKKHRPEKKFKPS